MPNGRYTLCFYDKDGHFQTYEGTPIDIGPDSNRGNNYQLGINMLNAHGSNRNGVGSSTTTSDRRPQEIDPGKEALMARPRDTHQGPHEHTETELEQQRYLHAMDLEDRQQEFIKNSTYVTEIAEMFSLNRTMRREMMEMQRIIVQQSQQAYKDIELLKNNMHSMFQLQKEVLAHASEQIGRPPTPPPDYVGLGHTALAVVREIGVALINRSQVREGEPLRASAKLPQLPAPNAEAKEAVASKPPDIIEKVISKIRSVGEIDLALAMSSPEKWKALMDEFFSQKPEPSTASKPNDEQAKP